MDKDIEIPLQKIAKGPNKFVLAMAGGGAATLLIMTDGGLSGTILEATVLSHRDAFITFNKGMPDKFASSETARSLAMQCYKRAVRYSDEYHAIGVACTASLRRASWEEERQGRKHVIHVAAQTSLATTVTNVVFAEDTTYTRHDQEYFASGLMVETIAQYQGFDTDEIFDGNEFNNCEVTHEQELATEVIAAVVNGHRDSSDASDVRALLPSSCNPFHEGHLRMMAVAARLLGHPIHVELCVDNPDKPSLDYISIDRRMEQVEKAVYKNRAAFGGIVLSNKPTFLQKSALYPGVTFVVGTDTLERIANPKYYVGGGDEAILGIMQMRHNRNRFLVFPRPTHEGKGGADPSLFNELLKISTIVGADDYTPTDTSSSQIRKGR